MKAARGPKSDFLAGIEDPLHILRNEHASLLGQLGLLERRPRAGARTGALLRTLIRDSAVHFRRESILLGALGSKLGTAGRSFQVLRAEHRLLQRHAAACLKVNARRPRTGQVRDAGHRILIHELTEKFRTHIQHEETVVYVLARTRLNVRDRKRIAARMLAV